MAETRIRWTPAEWELICAWILNHYEIECTRSSEYASIGVKEIELAMKIVIERGRWRDTLPIKATKLMFVQHMNELKKKKREHDLHEIRLREEEKLKREAVEREERYANMRMLEVNKPLIELMVTEMINRILPNIQQILQTHMVDVGRIVDERLIAFLGTEKEKEELKISKEAEERINKLTEIRRKPRVAVIGTMPVQSQLLAETYPDIDFVCIDKKLDGASDKKVKQAVHGCAVVFGMARNMGHNIRDETIQSVVGKDNYIKIYGAASDLKRQVGVCVQSQRILLAN